MVTVTTSCLPLVSGAQEARSAVKFDLLLILLSVAVVVLAFDSSRSPSADVAAFPAVSLKLAHSWSRAVQPAPSDPLAVVVPSVGTWPSLPAPPSRPSSERASVTTEVFSRASFSGVRTFSCCSASSAVLTPPHLFFSLQMSTPLTASS